MSASNKTLNLYPIDYPFETIVSRIENKKIILDPEFQRKYKWDKDGWSRASQFIESCLMRIPLPNCYFAENEDNKQLVIDGVQRLTTIYKFFNNKFALEDLTTFTELEGKKFEDLGQFKSELETTTIRCFILRKENPKELIQEIFARLNQGAVALSSQEIRHAIYHGSLDELLTELAEIESVKSFGLGANSQREKNSREAEEQVLRFFALRENSLDSYGGKLHKFLDRFMRENQNLSKEKIDKLRILFQKTLDKCIEVFGDQAFINPSQKRSQQSMVYYDLLMWSFSQKEPSFITKNKDKIKQKFDELCTMDEFKKTLSGGLQQKNSILKRRQLWEDKLSEIN
jgi:nucleoid DNA-binding protein